MPMQQPVRNLVAGLLASGLATLTGMLVVPLYLRALGPEGYGLVALFLTLQGLLQVFDLGLTATANREVARARAHQDPSGATAVLRALAWITWAAAAALTLLLLAATPWLAGHWLQAEQLAHDEVSGALLLMALALGVRWPGGLYQNILLGSDRMDRWSTISVASTFLSHGGAAILLAFTGGGLTVFFAWQVVAAAAHVLWVRAAAKGLHPPAHPGPADLSVLRQVRGFSLGMAAIGATSLALMHLDKLLLSRLLPLATFGHYTLAYMIAGVLYALVTPIFNWAYPRLSQMAATRPGLLQDHYRLLSHVMACLFLPLGMGVAVGSEGLLALWLGDPALAVSLGPVLALLLAGSALHCVMFLPYALTLARGRADIALRINLALLGVLVPLLLVLATRYGAMGAALAWAVLHAGYLLFGGWFTNRALLPEAAVLWLREDVLPVLLLCVALGLAGYALLSGPWSGVPPSLKLLSGLSLCVLGWAAAFAGSHRLRRVARALSVESAA